MAAQRQLAAARSDWPCPPAPAFIEVTEKVHDIGIEAVRILDALSARSTSAIAVRVQNLRGKMLQAKQAARAYTLGDRKDVCAIAGHPGLSEFIAELSEEADRIAASNARRPQTEQQPPTRTIVAAEGVGWRSNEVQLSNVDQQKLNSRCRAKTTTFFGLDDAHFFMESLAVLAREVSNAHREITIA